MTYNKTIEGNGDQFYGMLLSWHIMVILLGLFAIFGNGLVLHASFGKKNILRAPVLLDLDMIIKSLAMTDLLIGLLGIPFRIIAVHFENSNTDWNEGHIKGIYLKAL